MNRRLFVSLFALIALVTASSFAHAFPNKMKPLRSQIYANAKASGELQGVNRPSLRVSKEKNGKVSATLYTVRGGSRSAWSKASFRVVKTTEGKIAAPIKSHGEVWHPAQPTE